MLRALRLLVVAVAATNALHKYAEHRRYRRQAESVPPLDLNVTVPYIFSARLYPFGASRGDIVVAGDEEAYRPENLIHFMGETYDTIYIRKDGSVGFSARALYAHSLPVREPTIAVFWTNANSANVHFRETSDIDILNLAHNEVNIQYRYGSQFHVKSVIIVTWEGSSESQESDGNLFQLALIIGEEMTFAHYVYSRLTPGTNAVAGFSSSSNFNTSFSLPDSSTTNAYLLGERSDIGIPGEWLFRVDNEQIFLCGAGFKGLECVESCASSQWSNDCYRSCHCEGGDACDHETGRCPSGRCSPGWRGEPICDKDKDECATGEAICPAEQPDCMNTPGSFLCLCFEYDEERKTCKGAPETATPSEPIAVDVLPISPSIGRPQVKKPAQVAKRPQQKPKKAPLPTSVPAPEINHIFPVHVEAPPPPAPTASPTTRPPAVIDICASCDARAECVNGACKCLPGWEGDGYSCIDADECAVAGICGQFAICRNTPGSFDCDCLPRFQFVNGSCVDVDECQNSPCGLGSGVRCVNVPGSYVCECEDGYEGDAALGCTDINECKIQDACGPNAMCTNTIGGFECECRPGFERLHENGNCTDIDECVVQPCHPAAYCTNTPGNYECSCMGGFVGNGIECHEMQLYPIANDSIVMPRSSTPSSLAISLPRPLLYFGRKYTTAYLSSNGVISFGHPIDGIVEKPQKNGIPAIYALHLPIDYSKEGLIAYTFVNESDEAGQSLLSRANIAAESQFKLPAFRPNHLHIFTFDRLRQAGSDHMSSFQVVVACSDDVTLALMIYQQVQAKGAISGLNSLASFYELPSAVLSTKSNVEQPGRWMMRIDTLLEPCPSGKTNAPLCDRECSSGTWGFGCTSSCHCAGGLPCDFTNGICHSGRCAAGWQGDHCDEDIDECKSGVVTCSVGANCVNNVGGYECHCRAGFAADGISCALVDECRLRFGKSCHPSAECRNGVCRCRDGLHGDGFHCESTSVEHVGRQLLDADEKEPPLDSEVADQPFVMKTWQPPRLSTRPKLVTVPVKTEPAADTVKPVFPAVTEEPEQVSLMPAIIAIPGIVAILITVMVVCFCLLRKRSGSPKSPADQVWQTAPSRRTGTGARPVPAISHPNIIYGRRHY